MVVADVVVVVVAVAGVAVVLVCCFLTNSNAAGFLYMQDVGARSVKTRHAYISSCVPSSVVEAICFEVAMVVPWIDAFTHHCGAFSEVSLSWHCLLVGAVLKSDCVGMCLIALVMRLCLDTTQRMHACSV